MSEYCILRQLTNLLANKKGLHKSLQTSELWDVNYYI